MGYKYQDPQRTGAIARTAPTGKTMSPQQVAALLQKQKKTIDELQAQLKEKTARIDALTAKTKRHEQFTQAAHPTSERVASLEKELADITERLQSSETRAGELTERNGVQSAAYAELKVSFDNERVLNQELVAKVKDAESRAEIARGELLDARADADKARAQLADLESVVRPVEGAVIFEGVLDASGLERVKGACL